MEKKILKLYLSNIKNAKSISNNIDLFIDKYGILYNSDDTENKLDFTKFEKRKVLNIHLQCKESNILLEQQLTIQQISMLKYLYLKMGYSFKLETNVIDKDNQSLLDKLTIL